MGKVSEYPSIYDTLAEELHAAVEAR